MINSLLRTIIDKLPPAWSQLPIVALHCIRDRKEIAVTRKKVYEYERKLKEKGSLTSDQKLLLKSLKAYSIHWSGPGAEKFLTSYLGNNDIHCLKRSSERMVPPEEVILICCVKNDLQRIKLLLSHHRSIGVHHFVFVDNMSTDGTVEWLLQQDVDVYQTGERYHAGAKAAWVRRIWDTYGYNRWYLIVDSDELFSYPGMERHLIRELVLYAQVHQIMRVCSMMLDMYTDKTLFEDSKEQDMVNAYRYFDTKTYFRTRDYRGMIIRGGPRKRIFESEQDYATPLTKYPLLFVRCEDLWQDHAPYPFHENFKSECIAVLRHYKFINGDKEKYKAIVREGNYYNGSFEYKTYLKKIEEGDFTSFYYEDSEEYTDSYSLLKIPFIKCVFKNSESTQPFHRNAP